MASSYLVEVLLQAQNQLGPKLAEAAAQVEALQSKFGIGESAATRLAGRIGQVGSGLSQLGALGVVGGIAGVGLAITGVAFAAEQGANRVRELADQARDLYVVSARTGLAVGTIETFQTALERLGLPAEKITVAMRFFNKALTDNVTSMKQFEGATPVELLRRLGVTSTDANVALYQVADAFSKMKDGAEKSNLAVALFGRSGTMMIPVLNEGAPALKEWGKHLETIGFALTNTQAQALASYSARWYDLSVRMQGMWRQLEISALPALTEVVNLIAQIPIFLLRADQAFTVFIASLEKLGGRPVVNLFGDKGSLGAAQQQYDLRMQATRQNFILDEQQIAQLKKDLETFDPAKVLAQLRKITGEEALAGGGGGASVDAAGLLNAALFSGGGGKGGGAPGLRDAFDPKAATKAFENLTKAMKDVKVPTEKLTDMIKDDFGLKVLHALEVADKAVAKFNSGATADFQRAFDRILTITTNSTNVLVQLMTDLLNSFIQAFTDAIAKAAGDALSNALAPVIGSVIGVAFGLPPLPAAAGPVAGGAMTVNISAISAKDVIQQLVSPNGDFRRANMRLREVAATR